MVGCGVAAAEVLPEVTQRFIQIMNKKAWKMKFEDYKREVKPQHHTNNMA